MEMNEKELKKKKAVALRYDPPKDRAPRVVAQGKGELAMRIIEMARDYDVPIHEDRTLVEALSLLDLGTEIPEELYQVVAEILAFIYRLEYKKK